MQKRESLLPDSHELPLEKLKTIADTLFPGAIDWVEGGSGFMPCPGIRLHTTSNQERNCRIILGDGRPPTISCFHASCNTEVEQANKKLRSAIGKAQCKGKPMETRPVPVIQKADAQKAETTALRRITPVPLPTEEIAHPSRAFLESLFEPEELVAIYDCRESDRRTGPDGRTKYSPGAGTTRRVSELIFAADAKGGILNLYQNRLTLFIRANPMQPNGRSDREVASYRYVLVDIDKDEHGNEYPLEVQYGALIASKLPLASVTYSGDISLAALVRVDAETEVEYRSRRDQVYERMKQFIKIDEACGNPSRWTRFPGGTRHLRNPSDRDVYQEQRLIALNQGTSCWSEFLAAVEQEREGFQLANPQNTSFALKDQCTVNIFARTDHEEHSQYGITYNGSKPVVNLAVISRVLRNHPEWRGKIFYDTFLKRIFSKRGTETPTEWNDLFDSYALLWLQETFGLPNASIDDLRRAIPVIAHENQTNCLQEWLSSLEWDSQPRLASLLSTGFGAEISEYHSRVGECWLISMAARAVKPGCKVDTLPVFEGEQGAGKSSGLGILGGELFTECHEQITSKDFYSVLAGRWLVEISEMNSFSKTEVERIKGIISNQTDRYRLPYDKHASDHPRQCVFAGTTNRDDWHNDDTGGRRFWPVACGVVDLQWLKENRDQLFAEAVVRYQNGESWWDVPADEHRQKIDARRQEDTWTGSVLTYMEDNAPCSMDAVLRSGVGKQTETQTSGDQRRCAAILKLHGYENFFDNSDGKRRKWRKREVK